MVHKCNRGASRGNKPLKRWYKPWRPKGYFNLSNILALPDSFEYLCYGSMAIINFISAVFSLTDDFRYQNSKVYRRSERVKIAKVLIRED